MTKQIDSVDFKKHQKILIINTLFWSFLLFQVGGFLDSLFRCADVESLAMNGIINGIFLCIPWVILIAPLTFLLHFFYFRKTAKRICWPVVFAPSAIPLLLVAVGLVVYPPSVRGRFHLYGKAELPEDAQNLKHSFTGGGFIGDHMDDYYFQTTPDQVDRLIREMKLDVEEDQLSPLDTYEYRLPEFPDLSTWKHPKRYRRAEDGNGFFRCLITDSSRMQVYISLKSI